MTLRKGQHLFNEISKMNLLQSSIVQIVENSGSDNPKIKNLEFPYYNLHQILFYMNDSEFNKIMSTLQNYSNVEEEKK